VTPGEIRAERAACQAMWGVVLAWTSGDEGDVADAVTLAARAGLWPLGAGVWPGDEAAAGECLSAALAGRGNERMKRERTLIAV
jgi:hypothetical protein